MLEYLKHNETSQPERPHSLITSSIHIHSEEKRKGKEMEGSPKKKIIPKEMNFAETIQMHQDRISRIKVRIVEEERRTMRLTQSRKRVEILRKAALRVTSSNQVGVLISTIVIQYLQGFQSSSTSTHGKNQIAEQNAVVKQFVMLIQEKQNSILALQGQVEDLVYLKAAAKERKESEPQRTTTCGLPLGVLVCLGRGRMKSLEDGLIPTIAKCAKADPTQLLLNLKKIRDSLREMQQKEKEAQVEHLTLKQQLVLV
jgi:hypothetical protein